MVVVWVVGVVVVLGIVVGFERIILVLRYSCFKNFVFNYCFFRCFIKCILGIIVYFVININFFIVFIFVSCVCFCLKL